MMSAIRSEKARLRCIAAVAVLAAGTVARSQAADPPMPRKIVLAAQVLDVRSGRYLRDAAVYIEGEHIEAIGPAQTVLAHAAADATLINLHDATVLPGLIDCHTHLMARIPEGENAYELNLLTKSEAYRAFEERLDARATLRAGFTTVRDVESGALGLRRCRASGRDNCRARGGPAHAGGHARNSRS